MLNRNDAFRWTRTASLLVFNCTVASYRILQSCSIRFVKKRLARGMRMIRSTVGIMQYRHDGIIKLCNGFLRHEA
jgi:hypothetical protein